MNTSSLYKRRFKKEDLLKYTLSVAVLMTKELADIISKEEAIEKIRRVVDKFMKKYGE